VSRLPRRPAGCGTGRSWAASRRHTELRRRRRRLGR